MPDDWLDLQKVGFSRPILVVLKTPRCDRRDGGRTQRSLGSCRLGSGKRRYGKILFVAEQDFERASTGHAVIITPPPSTGPERRIVRSLLVHIAGLRAPQKTSSRGKI